ncbi:transposase [Micromonospora sp. MH33]|uniref:transposase n=1 Tax=Micromonospora sp. MH33 TaxID=1945509 RepID=UPI00143DA40D|nr:transposase [Micromonospora sp. MH33]
MGRQRRRPVLERLKGPPDRNLRPRDQQRYRRRRRPRTPAGAEPDRQRGHHRGHRPGRESHHRHPPATTRLAAAARRQQTSDNWQDKYRLRAGVEGTINQALDITGIRHARYRGLAKTRLQHVFSAIALNLVRLHAWWTEHPLPAARTSNLQRLDLALAA